MDNSLTNTKIYFDCIRPDDYTSMNDRPQKYELGTGITYDEFGYNFTKPLLETRQFVDTSMLYDLLRNYDERADIRNQTMDWCDPPPEIFLPKVKPLTIEQISQKVLSELEAQSYKNEVANNATLTQLEILNIETSLDNNAILSELQSIRASIASINAHNVSAVDSK